MLEDLDFNKRNYLPNSWFARSNYDRDAEHVAAREFEEETLSVFRHRYSAQDIYWKLRTNPERTFWLRQSKQFFFVIRFNMSLDEVENLRFVMSNRIKEMKKAGDPIEIDGIVRNVYDPDF